MSYTQKLGWSLAMRAGLGVAALVGLAGSQSALAVDGTWNGISGAWSDTTDPGGVWAGGIVADGIDGNANFTGVNIAANQTINLNDVGRTIGNITFTDATTSSNDLTISGANILTLDVSAGAPIINVTQSGRSLTISSQVSGNDGLQKNGPGNLTLSSTANDFSGNIIINGGQLRIASDARLGNVNNDISFSSTGALLATTTAGYALPATRTISVSSGAIAILGDINVNTNPLTNTIDGQITGAGGVQVGHYQLGSGVINLNNTANDFTGSLTLGRSAVFGNFSYSTYTANVAGLADGVGYGNIIFGQGNNSAANTALFVWSNSANAPLTLDNRRIQLDGSVEGAVLSNNNANAANTITVNTDLLVSRAGNKTFTLSGSNTGNNEFAGDISNSVAPAAVITLAKTGTGTWTISGNNSHSGGTSATAGRLNINSATALGTGTFTLGAITFDNTSGAPITNANNNAIAWNGDNTFVASNDLDLGTGNVTLGGNRTITTQNNGGILTFGGDISGAFGITKGGGGTMVLLGSSGYTGNTTVNQGTLRINSIADYSSNSAIGAPASGDIQLGSTNLNGTLNYIGGGHSSNRTFRIGSNTATATHTGSSIISNDGTGALTFTAGIFNSAAASATVARSLTLRGTSTGFINEIQGVIQNNAAGALVSLVKSDASTWRLSGVNTYTGTTTVSAGTLQVNGSLAAASAVSVGALGTLAGTGVIGGTVAVDGILSPGNSIESLASGALTMNSGSTFVFEAVDSSATGTDLMVVNGGLSLTSVTLDLTGADLDANTWTVGNKLTLFSYTGSAITSGFVGYNDDNNYIFGLNTWRFNYDDAAKGNNFASDAPAPGPGVQFVTFTLVAVVPEPSSLAMLAFGMFSLWLFRRRE